MVVRCTTTYAISAYHHWCCEFESRSGRGVQPLCDKVCQWLATGRWFIPDSSTNKTDHHTITEILLKVTLNTIKQNKQTNKQTYSISAKQRDVTNVDVLTYSTMTETQQISALWSSL